MPSRFLTAVVLLASTACWAAEGTATAKLRYVEYGAMQVRPQNVTGTLVYQRRQCSRVRDRIDRIPMTAGAGFGFRGWIDADQGRKLVVLVTWSLPGGDSVAVAPDRLHQAYFGTVRNHSMFSHCYGLDDSSEMVPGDWKLAVYLVGIDERVSVARARLKERQPSLIYQKTFHLYVPE